MKMDSPDDIERLMRLKRYESPDKEYFDRFKAEFRERQRMGICNISARQLLLERVTVWFSQCTLAKCGIPLAVMSVIGLTAGWFFVSSSHSVRTPEIAMDQTQQSSQDSESSSDRAQDFELQLPQISSRIPGIPGQPSNQASSQTSNQASNGTKILPAGVRLGLREL